METVRFLSTVLLCRTVYDLRSPNRHLRGPSQEQDFSLHCLLTAHLLLRRIWRVVNENIIIIIIRAQQSQSPYSALLQELGLITREQRLQITPKTLM